jgi:hypothetical protein
MKLAKNQNGEATIALNFGRDAFDLARAYPIELNADGVFREYILRPASRELIVIRIGRDDELLRAMAQTARLNIQIDQENFTMNLGNYNITRTEMNECLGLKTTPIMNAAIPTMSVDTKPVVPIDDGADAVIVSDVPFAPMAPRNVQEMAEIESLKNDRIESLLAENKALSTQLEAQRAINTLAVADAAPIQNNDDMDIRLRQAANQIDVLNSEIAALKDENETLKVIKNTEVDALNARLSQLQNEKVEIESRMQSNMSVANSAAEADLIAMSKRLADAQANNEKLSRQLENQINSADANDSELAQVNATLQKNMAEANAEIASLRAEITELQVKAATSESFNDAQMSELNERVRTLQQNNAQLLAQINNQSDAMSASAQAEVNRLSEKLANVEAENQSLTAQLQKMEQDLIASRQSMNPNVATLLNEKDQQIAMLESQNEKLRGEMVALNNRAPEIIEKEVVVYRDRASNDNLDLQELETNIASLTAERDEYRRLLHAERDRIREGKSDIGTPSVNVEELRQLQAEKAELVRQLEFVKRGGNATALRDKISDNQDGAVEIAELQAEIGQLQGRLNEVQNENQTLEKRIKTVDAEAQRAQRILAEQESAQLNRREQTAMAEEEQRRAAQEKVRELAELSTPDAYQDELNERTLRAEQFAERAQNEMMGDVDALAAATPSHGVSKPIKDVDDLRARLAERSSQGNDIRQGANVAAVSKTTREMMQPVQSPNANQSLQLNNDDNAQLSGDDIRNLINRSNVPLQTPVEKISRVSGPDFAAFRWDTGSVFGSAEQSRLTNMGSFDNAVKQYIEKTQTRCRGTFDETVTSVTKPINGKAMTADIACVSENAQGSAASILFFERDNYFYAIAHETDINGFTTAMDMRDRLVSGLN